jgi:CBS domain containing-hemolysin-like protein
MEEIVGEIQDEFDAEPPELERLGDGVYRVEGGMLIEDLEDALGIEISDRDEDTIAGVALSELGRSPEVGDKVTLGKLRLLIIEAEGNRIKRLRITLQTEPAGE